VCILQDPSTGSEKVHTPASLEAKTHSSAREKEESDTRGKKEKKNKIITTLGRKRKFRGGTKI